MTCRKNRFSKTAIYWNCPQDFPLALRHAALTHSLANGANILKVKEMAGYASLAPTQRYLHDLEALADSAVDYNPLTRIVVS